MADSIIDEAYIEAVKKHKEKMADILMDYYDANDDLNEYDMMDFGAVLSIIFAEQAGTKPHVVSTVNGERYLTVSKKLNAEETAVAESAEITKRALHNIAAKK